MASYVYKVTSEKRKLASGREANVAVFAYKPYRYGSVSDLEKINHKLAFKTGAVRAKAYVSNSKNYTGYVVIDDMDKAVECNMGSFLDDWFFLQIEKGYYIT